MRICLDDYSNSKQDIVLSHVPPACVINHIHRENSILGKYGFADGFMENTSLLGDECLKEHRPKLWVFGHHHKSFDKVIDGTRFVCLAELEVMILDETYRSC